MTWRPQGDVPPRSQVAGGNPPMRPDQALQPRSRAGSGPAPQTNVLVNPVIIITPGKGTFIYSPAPGPGNLIASIAATSGTDPYGNPYAGGGFASYVPSAGMLMQGNALIGVKPSGGHWVANGNIAFGATGILNINPEASVFVNGLAGGTWAWLTPSGDTTGATDSAAIANALSGPTPAQVVMLLTGRYYVNAPIVQPDQSALVCLNPSWGIPTGNYGAGSLPLQGAIITPVAAFSGGQVISWGSAGTSQHGGQRLYGITIDGSNLPAANTVNGIESVGYVGGVKIRDVTVWGGYNTGTTAGLGGHGLYAHNDGTLGHNPDFWNVDSSKFSACGGYGVETIAMSDSWFVNGECTGNNTGGGNIQNGQESRFIGWRFNNNNTTGTTPGLAYTGLSGFTGTILFDSCDFSANGVGVAVSGTGTGVISLANVTANANTTAFTYAGTNSVTGLSMVNQPAAPSQVAGYALPFATGGNLAVVSGNDGNVYDTQALHVEFTGGTQSITLNSFVNVTGASVAVAIGHYRLRTKVWLTTGAAAGAPQFQLTTPTLTASSFMAVFTQTGGAATSPVGRANSGSVTPGAGITLGGAGTGQIFDAEWDLTFSASGTVQLQAQTTIAADNFVINTVYMDLIPVN